ncbi:hypothetical protein BH24ACI3_BH24ACI3_06470 [soil metagenome]
MFLTGVYYILPNLSLFTFRTEAANAMMPNGAMLGGGTAYAIVYITVLLFITVMIFSRRNFK